MAGNKDTFAIFGLSRFGQRMAVSLFEASHAVLALDRDESLVKRISPYCTRAVAANAVDWDVLDRLGFFSVDVAIVGFRRSFDVAVLLVHQIRKRGGITIIAQADTDEKAEALSAMGAHTVVFPERDTADHLVRRLTRPNLVEHIPLGPDIEIVEVPIPPSFDGKNLLELRLRNRFEVHVIGVKQRTADGVTVDTQIAPPPNMPMRAGDTMLVIGKSVNVARFMAERDAG